MVQRRAARILLLDERNRILLFQFARTTDERFWATPGGGLEEGETFEEAAARELKEELGLRDVALTPAWSRSVTFPWGDDWAVQSEQYFLARVAHFEVPAHLAQTHAAEGILSAKWWELAELEHSPETIFPENLAHDLSAFVTDR